MKRAGIFCILVVVIFGGAHLWAADEYPSKPVQLVCPYGAGGLTDLVARFLADRMPKYLGQSIVVVNKPGGATAIGTGFVAGSNKMLK